MKTGTKYFIIIGLLMVGCICLAGCTGTATGTADPIIGTFEGNLTSISKCTVYFGSDNSYETFCNNYEKACGTWKKTGPNLYEAAIDGQTVSFKYYPDIDTLIFKTMDFIKNEETSIYMYRPGKAPKL